MARERLSHCCGPACRCAQPFECYRSAESHPSSDCLVCAGREVSDEELTAEPMPNPAHPLRSAQSIDQLYGRRHIVLDHVIEVEGADALWLLRLAGASMMKQKHIEASAVECSDE